MNELKACPFCGEKPTYYRSVSLCNFNHVSRGTVGEVKERDTENIYCDNLQCSIRPRLTRIESNDAIQLWNIRY